MDRELIYFIGDLGLLIGFLFVLLFVGRYLTISKWQRTKTGRALASFMTVIAAILGFVTVVAFIGDFPLRPYIRFGLYWWFAGSAIYFFVRLIHAQKRDSVTSAQVLDSKKGNSHVEGRDGQGVDQA